MPKTYQWFFFFVVVAIGCGCDRERDAAPQASPAAAQSVQTSDDEAMQDFELTNFKWDGPMAAGDSLQLRNPYGDIRCRKSGTQELIVSAQIQTFSDWQTPPRIEVIENNGQFEIVVEHDHPARAPFGGDYQSGFAGRIDVAVLLPPATSASLATTDGTLRVKGFIGDIVARTTTGKIDYRGKGAFELHSQNGDIAAVVSDFHPGDGGEIQTGTGAVNLQIPADASATVEAESAGQINILPESTVRQDRSPKRFQLKLGDGARNLKVHSDTGDINIDVSPATAD